MNYQKRLFSRTMICLVSLLAIGHGAATLLQAQTRRAVLVGINLYGPGQEVSRTAAHRTWRNLKGCVNDVQVMKGLLKGRYSFDERDILVLTDRHATRQAIISAIQHHLIAKTTKGDVCVFYFAGHGSQVRNRYSTEHDRMDETLVPADWDLHGDIRDKELKILFNHILDKGARLTVIIDACHSGSISRGIPAGIEYRSLPPATESIAEPSDAPDPVQRGALVLTAAQDFELAQEKKLESDLYRGVFSWALTRVLAGVPIDEPADQILMRVRALMQSEGCHLKAPSTPNLELRGVAGRQTLFGIPEGARASVSATALHIHRKLVTLQGGIASSIHTGCQLKKIEGDSAISPTVIEVFRLLGLDRCLARVIDGTPQAIQPGDFFELINWAAPPEIRMKIWLPICPLEPNDILRIARKTQELVKHHPCLQWVGDPTLVNPTHIMFWIDNRWQIAAIKGTIIPLGDRPSTGHIAQALKTLCAMGTGTSFFYLHLPIDQTTARAIESHITFAREAIEPQESSLDAHYLLAGRLHNHHVEYAWLRPNTAPSQNRDALLPVRSDWLPPDSLDTLCSHLLRLVKIRAWHQLPCPPDSGQFPYRLALRNLSTGKIPKVPQLVEGETYQLELRAREGRAQKVGNGRYIYIFVIDSQGTGTLLFPSLIRRNSENHFPLRADEHPKRIDLGSETAFKVKAPFGTDTFFLLATEQAITSPEVLDFSGVYRAYQIPAQYSPLERLLYGLGSGHRQRIDVTPVSWSVQRLHLPSVPKSID